MQLSTRQLLQLAGLFALLTALAIPTVDRPVAHALTELDPQLGNAMIWVAEWPALFWLHKWGSLFVMCAVALALIAIPAYRRLGPALLAVIFLHYICRYIVNIIKGATGRLRPTEWLKLGSHDMFFVDSKSAVGFPSGHTTQFASVLLPLATFFKLPRWACVAAVVVPVVVGTGRILQNAHFVSDVTGAMAVCAALTAAVNALSPYLRTLAMKLEKAR
jgi:membrane-associated phospholipid phosphatase